jgi:hypothetical protein
MSRTKKRAWLFDSFADEQNLRFCQRQFQARANSTAAASRRSYRWTLARDDVACQQISCAASSDRCCSSAGKAVTATCPRWPQVPQGVCEYKRVTYTVTNPCDANVSMHYTVRLITQVWQATSLLGVTLQDSRSIVVGSAGLHVHCAALTRQFALQHWSAASTLCNVILPRSCDAHVREFLSASAHPLPL